MFLRPIYVEMAPFAPGLLWTHNVHYTYSMVSVQIVQFDANKKLGASPSKHPFDRERVERPRQHLGLSGEKSFLMFNATLQSRARDKERRHRRRERERERGAVLRTNQLSYNLQFSASVKKERKKGRNGVIGRTNHGERERGAQKVAETFLFPPPSSAPPVYFTLVPSIVLQIRIVLAKVK